MCGRYGFSPTSQALAARFSGVDWPAQSPRYNVAPGQPVPTILPGPQPALDNLHWGIELPGPRPGGRGRQLINVRAETAVRPGLFRRLLETSRVIIPASHFYEWRAGSGRRRQPMMIRSATDQVLAFAGLQGRWANPSTGEVERAVVIITCPPNAAMATVHNRMPVILDMGSDAMWLDPVADPTRVAKLLRPCPDDWLTMVPISDLVNDVKNDGPELVLPAAGLAGDHQLSLLDG
jgi:putative SOS response-associated peptidase YedK